MLQSLRIRNLAIVEDLRVEEVVRGTKPGQTISYGEVALLAGRPGAARAVGQAVKANPVLILVPCHRVVGARGPGGWSAFGTPERKVRLLELEKVPFIDE